MFLSPQVKRKEIHYIHSFLSIGHMCLYVYRGKHCHTPWVQSSEKGGGAEESYSAA